MINFLVETAPLWYSAGSALLSGTFFYVIRAYVKEKQASRQEFRYLNFLVISIAHASEQIVGDEWKKVQQDKFNELISKENFINK